MEQIRKISNDRTLSLRAKGLAFLLLETAMSFEKIKSLSTEGRDAQSTALKELIDAGYVKRKKQRFDGKFSVVYEFILTEKPLTDNQEVTENPEVVPSPSALPLPKTKKEKTTTSSSPKERNKRFSPPSQQDVSEYMEQRGWKRSQEMSFAFVDFYDSKGWMVGKNRMRDWRAAVRTWERNESDVSRPLPPAVQKLYSVDFTMQSEEVVIKAAVFCIEKSVAPPKSLVKRFFNNLTMKQKLQNACEAKSITNKMLPAV